MLFLFLFFSFFLFIFFFFFCGAIPVTQYLKVSSDELENIVGGRGRLSGEDELSGNWQIDSSAAVHREERNEQRTIGESAWKWSPVEKNSGQPNFCGFLRETSPLVINLSPLSFASVISRRRVQTNRRFLLPPVKSVADCRVSSFRLIESNWSLERWKFRCQGNLLAVCIKVLETNCVNESIETSVQRRKEFHRKKNWQPRRNVRERVSELG